MFLRFMKGACTIKQQPILNISFLDTNGVYQCGFCKGYSAQECLLAMIEKSKKCR